jgi:hypothetical protein
LATAPARGAPGAAAVPVGRVAIGRPKRSTSTTRVTTRSRTIVDGVTRAAAVVATLAPCVAGACAASAATAPMNADVEMPAASTRLASAA